MLRIYWLWNLIEDFHIIFIIAWILVSVVLKGSRHNRKYLAFSAVIYTLVLLYVTLLGRTVKSEYQMELSFLWEYRLALQGNTGWWMQIFDNIMLFVPMGWLYGAMRRRASWMRAIFFGACMSLFIELSQLVFKLGLFEFDDILNNTVGMIVGYSVYRIVTRRCQVQMKISR